MDTQPEPVKYFMREIEPTLYFMSMHPEKMDPALYFMDLQPSAMEPTRYLKDKKTGQKRFVLNKAGDVFKIMSVRINFGAGVNGGVFEVPVYVPRAFTSGFSSGFR